MNYKHYLKMIGLWALLAMSFPNESITAQTVYERPSYWSIYAFLDELANMGFIVLHDETKPYSKTMIAEKLDEAVKSKKITGRMAKELVFYRNIYCEPANSLVFDGEDRIQVKPSIHRLLSALPEVNYSDTLTRITLLPIADYTHSRNSAGSLWRRTTGMAAEMTIGKHLGLYGSLQDNMVNVMPTGPDMLMNGYTTPVKPYPDNYQYNELRGGVTYTWQWGMLGLVKDQVSWGPGYDGSNIIGGNYPSFPMLQFKLRPTRWLSIEYIHGWLNSGMLDSASSYYDNRNYRAVFREKNFAANLISIYPWKHTLVAFGNSVVYSDMGTDAAYLIPLNFFKSLDHNVTLMSHAGQNAQMFAMFSTRFIPKTHVYGSLFIDEITLAKVFDKISNSNTLGYKLGARVSNLITNITFTAEYTHTRPLVYDHYLAVSTYASNEYTLGHYLKDNVESTYLSVGYAPFKNVHITAEYRKTDKGPKLMTPANHNTGMPFLGSVMAQSTFYGVNLHWQPIKRIMINAGFNQTNNTGDKSLFPKYMYGKQNNVVFGLGVGI